MPLEHYLGDGLYVSFDGWSICLRAPRENGDHVVFLDRGMCRDLQEFVAKIWPPKSSQPGG